MEQLKEQIIIDSHFQKSVNLNLDLGAVDRINSYIPTHSSVLILKHYLKNILGSSTENATILIGPYGKGKSHLLLILLAFLQGEQTSLLKVLSKIEQLDMETAEMIRQVHREKQWFLPVMVSGNGSDLNRAFLYALKEALERENLGEIVPASDYSEAVKTLEQWQQDYPEVYEQWERFLTEKKETSENMKKRLNRMDETAMELFLQCYPRLTAGSKFLPMVQSDAMKIYQEVGRELKEHYGYAGIILVFDEFSKYIEGHGDKEFARNMKVLQDMCELANSSGEQKLHVILVAHKSIHEYEKGIDRSVKNAFRGVEGRLKEIRFHVTARNHYELIADTLVKKEPGFSRRFSEYKERTGYKEIIEKSYHLPCFFGLFQEYEQYVRVMGKGCFPLTPVCACILLHISEKVAQNERTVFTFLTGREQGSLVRMLEETTEFCVGADAVYDYFKNLFRENSDQTRIHNEWLKAEYALKHTKNSEEKKIIKAIALLRMIHQEDELPVADASIRLALGMREGDYQEAMGALKQREIVMFRSSMGTYAFKNRVGLNIEKELRKEIARQSERFPVCRYLCQVSELKYVLPKQYNQERNMTRYFQYEFLQAEDFLQMDTVKYLFEERFSDGKILALVSEQKIDREKIKQKTKELQDDRIVVLVPKQPFDSLGRLKKLAAILALKEQPRFQEDHKVLLRELELYEEDLVFEINASLERDFIPGNGGCSVIYKGEVSRYFENDMAFNRFLSKICESYYRFSPIVNHELLNIQHVSGQYLRARDKVVAALLREQGEKYQNGTAPECMVYRAAFVRTGIVDSNYKKDTGCIRILEETDAFLMRCIGQRGSFLELYRRLQGKDYGVRKGVIPLFLAQRLGMAEGVPVIYLQNKELEVNENVLNNVNDFPEDYELYLESESGKKEQYLRSLEQAWHIEGAAGTRQSRWIQLMDSMQRWYRSLPKYTMVTRGFSEKEQKKVRLFRNLLKRSERNPREFLFERIPEIMGEKDLPKTAESLLSIKGCMERVFEELQKCTIEDIRKIYGGKEQESLKGCLLSWYQKQDTAEQESILSKASHEFLIYLKQLRTNDELEIISCLSRIVLDLSMEDWNDDTQELFQKGLEDIKREVEGSADHREEKGKRTIILLDEQGNNIRRSYEADTSNSTSSFLKNMIEEAMEDFENTLETSQKVAVLAEVLQSLLE